MGEPRIITIDGRNFRASDEEELSAAQAYLAVQLRLAGALDLLLLTAEEKPEVDAQQLFSRLMISGRTAHLLAGCLTEVGKQWSYEDAVRNAERFAATTNPEDKKAMREALAGVVLCFRYVLLQSSRTPPSGPN